MSILVNDALVRQFKIGLYDKCQCGGYRRQVHCPKCGSTQCYASARMNSVIKIAYEEAGLTPQDVDIRGFKCKLCAHLFSELEVVSNCTAITKFSAKLAREERISQAIQSPAAKGLMEKVMKLREARATAQREPSVADEIDKEAK